MAEKTSTPTIALGIRPPTVERGETHSICLSLFISLQRHLCQGPLKPLRCQRIRSGLSQTWQENWVIKIQPFPPDSHLKGKRTAVHRWIHILYDMSHYHEQRSRCQKVRLQDLTKGEGSLSLVKTHQIKLYTYQDRHFRTLRVSSVLINDFKLSRYRVASHSWSLCVTANGTVTYRTVNTHGCRENNASSQMPGPFPSHSSPIGL